jgi:NAD(P)H-dependent flavin oxidoreductase YrpB (nitropropane dioxygenase family)
MTEPSPAVTCAAPAERSGLPPLVVRGRRLLPIVQGGMGVGISAHRLAGTVASLDAVGTIASVDLRRHHPDLMKASAHSDKATIDAANIAALSREIRAAKALAGGHSMVAVNVMRAVSERVRDLMARGAAAVQIGTAFAVTEEGDADIGFKRVLAGAKPEDIVEFMSVAGLPARAVRTPWLTNYLKYLPKLAAAAHKKPRCTLKFDCLIQCGLRDGIAKIGQFCIDMQLAAALRGDVAKGLFFRGASTLPFGSEIRPVRDLITYLVSGARPAPLAAAS